MSEQSAVGAITDEEWRAFQAIPDQGYSHRAWVDARIAERLSEQHQAMCGYAQIEEDGGLPCTYTGVVYRPGQRGS